MAAQRPNSWRTSGHIPVLIILQVIFIVLFGLFVRYDPHTAIKGPTSVSDSVGMITSTYPMFQDVHVMIFIGFGFLMTFLKKYGLSAVSLNMLCSAVTIEWAILVNGFFHPHCEDPTLSYNDCTTSWPYIDLNLISMLSADFATAAVLISFGVLLGTTTPLQLIIMSVIEIVLFVVNEVIGRAYFGAVDAGDTIFVHCFGAYFGLTISRVLYNRTNHESKKEGAAYTSDLFSMVGTVFLWMFWPSFNAAAAAPGDAQHRALMNTYFSLCACVLAAFAFSALVNPHRKFCMEHIQNATLAGGVAVGASADMMMTPVGALIIGTITGVISTCGFRWVTPFLADKLKTHDTCGVNNLHGMPALLGGIISVVLAALASPQTYGHFNDEFYTGNHTYGHKSMEEIFPETANGRTPTTQASMQFLALIVTIIFAVAGGAVTGYIMKYVGEWQNDHYQKGTTIVGLALNMGYLAGGIGGQGGALPKHLLFDDTAYFEVEEDEKKIIIKKEVSNGMVYNKEKGVTELNGKFQ